MTDVNAEKAWEQYAIPEGLVYNMPNSSERRAFMAGRASRDAEVAELKSEVAAKEFLLSDAEHNLKLVAQHRDALRLMDARARREAEASQREVESLHHQLAELRETSDNHYRNALEWKSRVAERDAVIERVRAGAYLVQMTSNPNDSGAYALTRDAEEALLSVAPSTALDAVKADAWDEGLRAPRIYNGSDPRIVNPYRKGANHE